jgi:uncharacterized alkaline shock family protein YloU
MSSPERPEQAERQDRAEHPEGRPRTQGQTRVADQVLQRIATYALSEVDEVGGVARRVLGVPLGQDRTAAKPRVQAHVDGRIATLQMTVSVVYPAPVRQVAHRVRDHVAGRVAEFTGLDVRQVDGEVASLVQERSQGRRVR